MFRYITVCKKKQREIIYCDFCHRKCPVNLKKHTKLGRCVAIMVQGKIAAKSDNIEPYRGKMYIAIQCSSGYSRPSAEDDFSCE